MKPIAVAGFALLVVLAGAGCPPKPAAPAVAQAPDLVAQVQGAVEQWRQAYEARSIDALARLYSRGAHEPGLILVEDSTRLVGWAAIEPVLRARLANATAVHVRLADLQVIALGADAAVASAKMTREATQGATTVTEQGLLTLALRRNDETWVIASEHYSYKRP
jgi:ketosteroid isomerase-like protein